MFSRVFFYFYLQTILDFYLLFFLFYVFLTLILLHDFFRFLFLH
jgi:hypothetical protein